jgi:uncharacterized membrane protein
VDKFIVPNFHVILIHFPLAMLAAGVAIELFSFMWRRSTFRVAGQWMILLGTLAAVPAVTTGLYALSDVMGHGQGFDSWVDLKNNSGFTKTDWNFITYHILMNAIGTGLALFAVVMWLGASDSWRRILRIPALLILIVALGAMTSGAWHGGEMTYRLGFGVQGKLAALPDAPAKPQTIHDKVEYYAPEGEIHLLMAGFVFAMAAAALGLSIRRAVTTETVVVQRVPPTYISAEAGREGNVKPISLLQALNDPGDEIPVTRTAPAARFWLIGSLLALAAIASGFWFGGYLMPWPWIIDRDHLTRAIHHINDPKRAREGLHIVFGGSILVLTLILALLTRFAPRSRVFFTAFSFLLILVMAAQIWIGVQMTFDGGRGPLARFKTPTEAADEDQPDTSSPATQPSLSPVPTTPSATPMTFGQ